eukprot:TRINITY_DN15021_c0_g1_i1.p1 TRINITY_DN15021_c0_g1~~TRINITY_DN15021_c0_g1_i1.p1  ORF type:complete len:365 (+),score=66.99 TRINITY_DN15021_c0_g1_i1:44-1138(+)
MLEMGFRSSLLSILEGVRQQRSIRGGPSSSSAEGHQQHQTALFSATLDTNMKDMKDIVLKKNHAYVDATIGEVVPHPTPQYYVQCNSWSHLVGTLYAILVAPENANLKKMVFVPTADFVKLYEAIFSKLGISCTKMAGRMKQSARTASMMSFRGASSSVVMICTDVLARGIDMPDVDLIIQAGQPSSTDNYLHRIGRTSRSGGVVGRGVLLLAPLEAPVLPALQKKATVQIQKIDIPISQEVSELVSSIPHRLSSYPPSTLGLFSIVSSLVGFYGGAYKANDIMHAVRDISAVTGLPAGKLSFQGMTKIPKDLAALLRQNNMAEEKPKELSHDKQKQKQRQRAAPATPETTKKQVVLSKHKKKN